MSSTGLIAGLVPAVIGALFLLAAARGRAANRRFEATARTVSGTVLALREESSSYIDDNGISHDTTTTVADVLFRTETGQEMQASATVTDRSVLGTTGTPVLLRYDPAKPTVVRLGGQPTPSSGPVILGFLGLMLIATGVAFALLF
jgi:hypothetical protein